MIFTNVENESVKTVDGRKIWISRSCAVVNLVAIYKSEEQEFYVLFGKRGPICPDEVGKWTMPCGYLDYNETLGEAAIRETWEECGVNIPAIREKYSNTGEFRVSAYNYDQPWRVTSDPSTNDKQNVSHYFCTMLNDVDFPDTTNKNALEGEVDEIRWISLTELKEMNRNGEIGFNHFYAVLKHEAIKTEK